MSTSPNTIETFANQEYKWGFVTDIEADTIPPRPERRRHPPDFGQEERAGVAARMAAEGLPALADHEGAHLGQRPLPAHRLPGHHLLRRAQDQRRPAQEPGRSRSGAAQDLRKAGHPAAGAGTAGRRRGGRGVRQRFGGHHLQGKARRTWASSSAPSPKPCRSIPSWCRKYLGSVVPTSDNFFAALNSAVFSDGSFCYVPKGVRCPMELSTYFRINAKDTGQFERTLIVADEGALRQLPGRLHRAHARHQPVARGGGGTGGARQRADQVFHRAELVSRRQGRQGRHLQFRHQARRLPRRQFQDLLDAGGDRLGHHLEISELPADRRQLGGRVLLGGADQQLPAGRHRHQDDPHREEHHQHHRLEGHLGRPRPEHLPRRRQDSEERRRRAQLLAVRFDAAGRSSAARTPSPTWK